MIPVRYRVAVDAPLREALTYLPPADGQVLARGQSVIVPLGKRQARGVILGVEAAADVPAADEPQFKLKEILSLDQTRPPLPEAYLGWLEWMSGYYLHPPGQIVESMFPPLKKNSGRKTRKTPVVKETGERRPPPELTQEQKQVVEAIESQSGFQPHLLHGVTGSGKTEVYLRLLEGILARDRRGLVLVPEIALTPQLIDRFSHRFPGGIAVLHSHLTEREKTNQWWSVAEGEKKILIGARSALFCPMPDLGLIVLDEEHEPSYKQDEKLKYHARDAAVVLARRLDIPIVLGSATPSLESWNNVLTGKYRLHAMKQRVNARPLPAVEVVDMRDEYHRRRDEPSTLPHWLSDRLHEELLEVWARGEQAALFLNRRGTAQTAQCHGCGHVAECPNCSVSLTVHARSHLVCHYCDYTERLSEICPECRESELSAIGLGTEKIEADMRALFPQLRIARADRDEIQSRDQLEQLIRSVENHEVDLLIGTQMIAKGLDFPQLNLVGLVLADVGFHLPDFRASERSFQLLTQVAGRAGRKNPGRVVIQTYDPSHPSIQFTVAADFAGFSERELSERREMNYPPFWRLALARVQGPDADATQACARRLVQRARVLSQKTPAYNENLLTLGPAPAPLFRLRGRFRYHVLIKAADPRTLHHFCRRLLGDESWVITKTKVQIDIDPFQML